jgi:NAD(P)-dependent dehydrogenase (short-subunit alcohol dehydrogenase family)
MVVLVTGASRGIGRTLAAAAAREGHDVVVYCLKNATQAAFVEVMIDPDAGVYPMVGPGQTYTQMITGDFIASRHDVEIKTPGPAEMF